MQSRLTKTIIGAIIAVALAVAVSYGLISQQTADQIQTQANQTLQNGQGTNGQVVNGQVANGPGTTPPAPQQPAPAPQNPNPQAPSQLGAPLQNPAPASRP